MTIREAGPSWKWLVGILVGIVLALIGAVAGGIQAQVSDQGKRLGAAEQAIVVMQTDLKYIGAGVDEIKGMLKRDWNRGPASPRGGI